MSIGRKISLLLGLLALVMIFQSIDRIVHLQSSARAFESLSLRVEQTLDGIETLSRANDQFEALSRDISGTSVLPALEDHRATLDNLLRKTRVAAQTLGLTPAASADLGRQLDVVGTSAAALIDRRADVLGLQRVQDSLRATLYAQSQSLQSYILPFRVRVLSGLARDNDVRTTESLRLLLTLTGLLVRIDDFLVTEALDQTDAIRSDIARLISTSVTALSTSPDLLDQKRVGATLAGIHRAIGKPDGLATTVPALRTAKMEEAAAASVLTASLYEIGVVLSDLVGQSEREIGEVYLEAARVAQNRIWSEILVNAGLGLGIVLAVWIVFARQISARLERLSDSVLRLAAGDLRPVEKPVGTDELTRMMRALEVFRRNARELRRSNEDLANFAYVASHDLRTPLRAIRDLVDWTIEDQGKTMQPEAMENLTLIRARADRLSRLLRDLLDYARAGQSIKPASPVDVAAMVRDIGELVGATDRLTLAFEGVPVVLVDVTPLHTILSNLIGNAVKHHDRDEIRITVSVISTSEGWDIRVEDDGPGIPTRYQDQVFELFKTLQSRDEVEGSGLGLAMVDKLTRHLEGSITLVSNPEQRRGTTFILHIPKPDRSHDMIIETVGAVA